MDYTHILRQLTDVTPAHDAYNFAVNLRTPSFSSASNVDGICSFKLATFDLKLL